MIEVVKGVGADLLPIPDGDNGAMVRIGIRVTPSLRVSGSIKLSEWPSEIAALAKNIRIRVAALKDPDVRPTTTVDTSSLLGNFLDGQHGLTKKLRHQAATSLWGQLFDPVGFDSLATALEDMAKEGEQVAEVVSSRTGCMQLFFESYFKAYGRFGTRAGLPEASAKARYDLARQVVRWMSKGSAQTSTNEAKGDEAQDVFKQRGEQLERLNRGLEALFGEPVVEAFSKETEPDYWSELGSLFHDHARALFGDVEDPKPPEDEPEEVEWGRDPVKAASRKLSGLLSLPSLCPYFGLGLEVEIPKAALGALTRGAIAAEFIDKDGNPVSSGEPAWTAFEFDPVTGEFGPASKDQPANPADALYSRGFWNLSAPIRGSRSQRFKLGTLDVVNMVRDFIRIGERSESSWADFPPRRRGIVLYDLASAQDLREAEQAAIAQAQSEDETIINYAEQLVIGMRPDFGIALKSSSSLAVAAERWRSVTARTITCTDPLLDQAYYDEPLIARIRHRDHGFATALVEEKQTLDGSTKLSREDEKFVWAGESLAVSARMKDIAVDKKWDLGLDLNYDLPDAAAHPELQMPPLREKVGYVCGGRLVYQNGAGPTLEAARRRYATDTGILIGDASRVPLVYPVEADQPPDVHLHWDDRLVRAINPKTEAPGESASMIVVRDGQGKAVRFVTPPRGSFDGAEMQSQFDTAKEDVPAGALAGKRGLWLFGPDGNFPEARFGRNYGGIRRLDGKMLRHVATVGSPLDAVELESVDYKKIPFPQSRGTVAVLGERRGDSLKAGSFYANANGRRLGATMRRASIETDAPPQEGTEREFWKLGEAPSKAVPILLQLGPVANGTARFDPDQSIGIVDVDGFGVNLPLLRVLLPPAETWTLDLGGANRGGATDNPRLTLVHAVEKPLQAPVFEPAKPPSELCASADLGLNAVTVTVRKDDVSGSSGLKSWAEKVVDFENSGVDQRCWPSEEGGATTFFVGRVALDRKSTGAMRCEARWIEFNENTVARNAAGRWIRNLAGETAVLFRTRVEHRGPEGLLDLARSAPALHPDADEQRHLAVTGKPGELRALSYAFRDGRARELKVRMVATSAFTAFYPEDTSKPQGDDWTGSYERASGKFEQAPSVWAECTFRPPVPKIDRIVPLFRWNKIDGKVESARRSADLRIYLDEGWYASGADERLGIVLLGDQTPATVCDYEKGVLEPYHRFITRTGTDPVRLSSRVPIRLEAKHFPNAPTAREGDLYLEEAGAENVSPTSTEAGAIDPLKVKILPFQPKFDEDSGLYCDIEIDLGDAYTPFVQLGLVRYQEHAVAHLRLSHAIEYQVQLLPERQLWVEVLPGYRKRQLHLSGQGFDIPEADPGQPAHKVPVLDLKILSWDSSAKEWQLTKTVATDLAPAIDQTTRRYTWQKAFELPLEESGIQTFVLLAEEYERLPYDTLMSMDDDGEPVFEEREGRRLTYSALLKMRSPQPL